MARTRASWKPGRPTLIHKRPRYRRAERLGPAVECEPAVPSSFPCAGVSLPTPRSPSLLLSLPWEILSEIFRLVIGDNITSCIVTATFYQFVDLIVVVKATRDLRHVCSLWTRILHAIYLASDASRGGILYSVEVSQLPLLKKAFPLLEGCVLDLGDPNRLVELEQKRAALQALGSGFASLDSIVAVALGDDLEKFCPGYPASLFETFCKAGLETLGIELPAWGPPDDSPLEPIPEPEPELIEFVENQFLSLSYYHAQIFRQVLCRLPQLRYLEVPAPMLPPLLSDSSYLLSEPTLEPLRSLDIEYNGYGESFVSILKSVCFVDVLSFPNPIYAAFPWSWAFYLHYRAPRFYRWLYDVGQRLKEKIKPHLQQTCRSVSLPHQCCGGLMGLGFRGLEVTSLDKDEDILEGWVDSTQMNVKNINVVSGQSPRTDLIDLSLLATSTTLTSLTIDSVPSEQSNKPHYHFCHLVSQGAFPNLAHLDVMLYSVCPRFFTNFSERAVNKRKAKQWRIRSRPNICQEWRDTARGGASESALKIVNYGLSFRHLAKIIDAARNSRGASSISDIAISVETYSQSKPANVFDKLVFPPGYAAWHNVLEILPFDNEVIYKGGPFFKPHPSMHTIDQRFDGDAFVTSAIEREHRDSGGNGIFETVRNIVRDWHPQLIEILELEHR